MHQVTGSEELLIDLEVVLLPEILSFAPFHQRLFKIFDAIGFSFGFKDSLQFF